jgi:predicted DNA-binding WGR domain protein
MTSHGFSDFTNAAALKTFRDQVQGLLDRGYAETARSLSRRYFQCTNGSSKKFWVIELDETSVVVRFGRIDTYGCWGHGWVDPFGRWHGRQTTKSFESPDQALASYYEQIDAKLAKGYVEVHRRKTAYSQTARGRRQESAK